MDKTAIAVVESKNTDLISFDESQVGLIKRQIAKEATDDELALFLHQCKKTGLDPLAKQIYFQKRNSKKGPPVMTIITGIDGYRLIAQRTGTYAGSDDVVYGEQEGLNHPTKATITVYKMVGGQPRAFSATARWSEYCPEFNDFMWRKMPFHMLGKVAEALALRKAFPAELSGMYIKEEMDQDHEDNSASEKNVQNVDALKARFSAPQIPQEAPPPDFIEGDFEEGDAYEPEPPPPPPLDLAVSIERMINSFANAGYAEHDVLKQVNKKSRKEITPSDIDKLRVIYKKWTEEV